MDGSLLVPLSMGFPRQEYLSGLSFPSPGIILIQGLNPCFLHWQDSLPLNHLKDWGGNRIQVNKVNHLKHNESSMKGVAGDGEVEAFEKCGRV